MYYLEAINSKAGFGMLSSKKGDGIIVYPYERLIEINEDEKKSILESESWYEYIYKNKFDDLLSAKTFMINEFLVGFFHHVIDFEKTINKGKLEKNDQEVKVDKLIAHLQKIYKTAPDKLKVLTVCNGLPHVFDVNKEQLMKIEAIRGDMIKQEEDLSVIPMRSSGLNGLEEFNFSSFYNYLTFYLDKQKRYLSIRDIIQYFSINSGIFDYGKDFKQDYDKYRELEANKKGYSTHMSFKKKEASIKKAIRRK